MLHPHGTSQQWLPLSRSYGYILPSSLTRVLPRTLGFSPRIPVSVYGTGGSSLTRSFSRQCGVNNFARISAHSASRLRLSVHGFAYAPPYTLTHALPFACLPALLCHSIAQTINDNEVRSSTLNALGNIFLIEEEYDIAEDYFLKALSISKDSLPNYFALIDLFLQQGTLDKAKKLLRKIPHDNPRYLYSIKEAYYNIQKQSGNYLQALQYLEECVCINDSMIIADNEARVLELEKKYNHLKIQKESLDLKFSQQKYKIITILCISIILFILLIGFWYKRKIENKIYKQKSELKEIKNQLLQLSLESEKRKEQLYMSISENERSRQIQKEIDSLFAKYHRLRMCILVDSAIYKKLKQLIKQNIPRNNKLLVTEEYWRLIIEQAKVIYPNLKYFLLERYPQMSEQEWRYCCLYMFGFDSNEEAKLLNITPGSARTKRFRLRQKLDISLSDEVSLYEYIARNVY